MEKVLVPAFHRVIIRSDGPFTVREEIDGKMTILGPNNSTDRVFSGGAYRHDRTFHVTGPSRVSFSHKLIKLAQPEKLDPQPLEAATQIRSTESLEEKMARIVRREMASSSDEPPETWEEFNDLDVDEPEYFTQYELQEMQDDAEIPTLAQLEGREPFADTPIPRSSEFSNEPPVRRQEAAQDGKDQSATGEPDAPRDGADPKAE